MLDEQVSIHDLRTILENLSSLWEYHGRNRKPKVFCSRAPLRSVLVAEGKGLAELDAADYSTCARLGLRSIPMRYLRTVENKTVMPVLLIDSKIEHRLQLLSESALLEDECQRFRLALFQALTSRPAEVILCGQANRRHVRNLIDMEFPTLAVLSSEEILPGTGEIQPVCTIAW